VEGHNGVFVPADWNRTYPVGVDPVWKGASNELLYYNSLKMKMAVILGVTQMCAGIVMKCLNAIHFRQELDLIFEFIPQIVLMLSLFGYLCFLIFYKWCTPYAYNDMMGLQPGTQAAPMLLNTMIYMFLSPFTVDETKVPALFDKGTQGLVQGILVILAAVSIPLMLLPKPLILRHRHNKSKQHFDVIDNGVHDDEAAVAPAAPSGGGHGHGHGEEFDFGEIFVHQVIETIEFVLGSVSNTASYLRLWALSLAHSELSTVFWDMGFVKLGIQMGPVGVVIIFAVWLGVTVGVLCVMETLSAFLHALRLHWVEFQNKFYKGDGKKFLPFSYERMFSGEDE
jgi:V-type H+-transporting ATPase subunit a